MGDRSDHRSASHHFFARVARRGGEANQTPLEAHGPARPDLTYPSASPRTFGGDPDHFPRGGFEIDEFPVPASLVAEVAEDRCARSGSGRRRGLFSVLTTIGVAAIVFVGTLLLARMYLSPPSSEAPANTGAQHQRPVAASGEPPSLPSPRLTSVDAATRDIDEAVFLNLSLLGTADGGSVTIKGLLSGSMVLGGRPSGEGRWSVDVARIQDVKVLAPRGFVGSMPLVLELHLADDTMADQRSVLLEWVAPNRVTAWAPADTQSSAAKVRPPDPGRAMRPGERQAVASLVARGKEVLRNGDFSSARLILRRAAEAHDAEAALTLGATYDPIILTQLGIRSQVADVELAATWYQKAEEFGSTEASSRLKMLTTVAH
jgi:hypothetical protein